MATELNCSNFNARLVVLVLAEEVGFKCSTYIQIGAPIAGSLFFLQLSGCCVCDRSILCSKYGDCEGWWLSSIRISGVEYWWLKLGALVLISSYCWLRCWVALFPGLPTVQFLIACSM